MLTVATFLAGLDRTWTPKPWIMGTLAPFKLLVQLVLRFRRRKQNWEVDMEDSTPVVAGAENEIKPHWCGGKFQVFFFGKSWSEEGNHGDHHDTINAAFWRNRRASNHKISSTFGQLNYSAHSSNNFPIWDGDTKAMTCWRNVPECSVHPSILCSPSILNAAAFSCSHEQ